MKNLLRFSIIILAANAAIAAEPVTGEGFIGVASDGETVFSWQSGPLPSPNGGGKFAASAFIHPLRTPAGFELTTIQPSDHLHHFGVWWPWKYIEVNGAKYNTWEIQEGQGGHVAKSAKLLSSKNGVHTWELKNQTIIKSPGAEPLAAIDETSTLTFSRDDDSHVLDIEIRQQAAGAPVKIINYRYSGFSWRGASSWNKDNSIMLTSGGKDRDHANGTTARWVLVTGDSPKGKATMLMMSAAADIAGAEEKVRVWDSKNHDGAPFVNFNPVMDKPLPLEAGNKAVSHRKYRIIAADRAIDAAEAEAAWRKWTVEGSGARG
jgi:hypothetical protein